MTPDSVEYMNRSVYHTRWKGLVVRTVLADGRETLFELPAGSTDGWQWLEDFDRLRSMDNTSRIKCGKSLNGIASTNAVSEVYDVLVGTCDRSER